MRRILLLKPYRPDILHVTGPPLGIMTVAGHVREKARERGVEIEFKLMDLNPARLLPDEVLPEILGFEPDLIGISCLSVESAAAHALTPELKKHLPHVPVVIGGPYPSHDRQRAMADDCIDYAVINEGEETFDELLQALSTGSDVAEVAGIGYRRDGEVHFTRPRPYIEDLDALPLPAYDLIHMPDYFNAPRHSRLWAHREYMTVVSTRGCPYQCTYCHVTMGKKTRFRSPESVVDELQHLVEGYGIREIQWSDDIWNLDKDRAKRICDLIVERGLDIKMAWPNGVRGDIFDDELLDKMKAAGAYMIVFAPESGSKRIQRYIKKNARIDKLKDVIAAAAKRNIYTHGYFMVGFPTETEDEMQMTFDYAVESKLNSASFFIVNANPGTVLYEQAVEAGLRVDFASNALNYIDPDFALSDVAPGEIRRRMRLTYLRLLLTPSRIWRMVRSVPNRMVLAWLALDLFQRLYRDFRGRQSDIYHAEGVPDFAELRLQRGAQPLNRA